MILATVVIVGLVGATLIPGVGGDISALVAVVALIVLVITRMVSTPTVG